jgi:hypothetical protein
MSKLTPAFVKSLIGELSATFKKEIQALRDEITALKSELDSCRCKCTTDVPNSNQWPWLSADTPSPTASKSFAKAVTDSVKTALSDDKTKSEVIIAKLPEKKHDAEDVQALCAELNFPHRPSAVSRLGKEPGERPRPLKVTFPTPFDARLFLTRTDANPDDRTLQ